MNIRIGGPADQQIVSQLNRELYEFENSRGYYQESFDLNWTFSDAGQSYFLQRLDPSDRFGVVLIAEIENDIIGYLAGGLRQPSYRSCVVAEIENMYVKHSSQRSGVGRALVGAFRDWATMSGARRLRVASFSNNEAVDFYRSVGLIPFETILESPLGRDL